MVGPPGLAALVLVALVLMALLVIPAPGEGLDPPAASTGEPVEHGRGGPPDRVLARPDSGPGAEDAFTAPAQALHHHDTTHFRLHFTTTTEDAAQNAFIKQAAVVFEQVWTAQVSDLGWPAPLPDDGLGGNDLVDVYFVDLGQGAFGYAAADEQALCGACNHVPGYLVMDNDYGGYRPDPLGALQATAAHEFSHLVQFGMAYNAEAWAYEATAVWLEQVVFPEADARTQYLVDFADAPQLSLSDFGTDSGGFDRSYGAYVWNLWLASRHGPDVVRDAWIAAAERDSHVLAGYGIALSDRGSRLEEEFVAFTAATAAWERGGFPGEPGGYPPIRREGFVPSGTVATVTVDHAAAYVVDVAPGHEVTVTVRGPKFVAGGIALVAGAGTEVLTEVDDTLFDGQASVTLTGVADATRVTLVIVNADTALAVPKPAGSDRPRYLFDDVSYLIGIDVDPGPPAKR
ncbi:MAG TPA: MXAN_6640 family putative metalloprotease [Euzebya sp.]|nr:MXAN_6640 family putative metalloprotease [Euzebya sp.]